MFEIKIEEDKKAEEIKEEIRNEAEAVQTEEVKVQAEAAAENPEEEVFKTTLMGGYDKEDVHRQFRELKAAAEAKQAELDQVIKSKDEEIEGLKKEIELVRSQMGSNVDLEAKYRSYVDNVDMIGRIIADSRIKSEETIKEANAQKDSIIAKAESEAAFKIRDAEQKAERKISEANSRANDMISGAETKSNDMVSGAQAKAEAMIAAANESVNEKLQDGANKYITIQEEIGSLVGLANRMQREFMQSIKKIHELSDSMNVSIDSDSDFEEN